MSLALDHPRGGSQLVGFDDGWQCLTHEVVALDEYRRRYLHRFVAFDRGYRVAALTEPFRLAEDPIEFAGGLALEPGRGELHAGYGVEDREAWLATFDASVRRALAAVP